MQLTGNAAVTNGSQIVEAATDVDWSQAKAGDWFMRAGIGTIYTVAAAAAFVSGHWQVTLASNYGGTTEAAAPCVVHQDFDDEGMPIFRVGDTEQVVLLNRAFQRLRAGLRNRSPNWRATVNVPAGGLASVAFDLPTDVLFDDLRASVNGRTDNVATVDSALLRFNGDAGTNYQYTQRYSDNAGAPAASAIIPSTTIPLAILAGAGSAAGCAGSGQAFIPGYRNTALRKQVMAVTTALSGTSNSLRNAQFAGVWLSTAAITTVLVFTGTGGNFVEGTMISVELIGQSGITAIAAAPPVVEIFSRALPAGVLTPQTFDFVTPKTGAWVPEITLENTVDADLEDIRFIITGRTDTSITITPVNAPPTANYILRVAA